MPKEVVTPPPQEATVIMVSLEDQVVRLATSNNEISNRRGQLSSNSFELLQEVTLDKHGGGVITTPSHDSVLMDC